jgi:hypothetical protein
MWLTINKLHEHVKDREMFVVRAFDVFLHPKATAPYTSDPWCVWYDEMYIDDVDKFVRWPHPFPPTHFCLLPEERE